MSDMITVERPVGVVIITADDYFGGELLDVMRQRFAKHMPVAKTAVISALHNPARPNDSGLFQLDTSHEGDSAVTQLTDFVHGPAGSLDERHPLQYVFGLADVPVELRPESALRQHQLVTYLRKQVIRSAINQLQRDNQLELIGVGKRTVWQPTASASGIHLSRTSAKEPCRRR